MRLSNCGLYHGVLVRFASELALAMPTTSCRRGTPRFAVFFLIRKDIEDLDGPWVIWEKQAVENELRSAPEKSLQD